MSTVEVSLFLEFSFFSPILADVLFVSFQTVSSTLRTWVVWSQNNLLRTKSQPLTCWWLGIWYFLVFTASSWSKRDFVLNPNVIHVQLGHCSCFYSFHPLGQSVQVMDMINPRPPKIPPVRRFEEKKRRLEEARIKAEVLSLVTGRGRIFWWLLALGRFFLSRSTNMFAGI